ncbi:MAG: hypothetical protein Kow0068_05210 [Marinilabiliales bacterium]
MNIIITPKIELDSLHISIAASNISGCGDSSQVTVYISNLGDSLTGAYNTADIELPPPFVYSGGEAYINITNNLLTFEVPPNIPSGATDSIVFYIRDTAFVNCGDSMQILSCVNAVSQYTCNTDTCYYSEIVDCDSTKFVIERPEVAFTGEITAYLCNDSEPLIELEIFNNTTFASDSIIIDYYCISDSTGSISPCLFWSENIATLGGHDTATIIATPPNLCNPNCTEIMAVLSGNCICENDTIYYSLSDAVTTPTVTDIIPYSSCMYVGEPFEFSAVTTDAEHYLWTFGGIDTVSVEEAEYTFDDYGYYCIKVEVSNSCGTAEYSGQYYIYEDECFCPQNIAYDITDTTYTTNEVWNINTATSGELYVDGDIHIALNTTLTIEGIEVKFSPRSRLIVERGGTLEIHDAILSGVDGTCKGMWYGIEVWGVSDVSSNSLYQGRVIIREDVKIENAHIGVLVGKRDIDYICRRYWLSSATPYDHDYAGGILNLKDGYQHFNNNGIDIKFDRKLGYYQDTLSTLVEAEFDCSTLIDDHYNINHPNYYPNMQNPWTGQANTLQRSSMGIDMQTRIGINIQRCNFNNKGTCVRLIDTKGNIFGLSTIFTESSMFTNSDYGIFIDNTISGISNNHAIYNCYFDHMANTGIYIRAGVADKIFNNVFGNHQEQVIIGQQYNNKAIVTLASTEYKITDNKIYSFQYGIVALNTGAGGAYIGSRNDPEGNQIYTTKINLLTAFDNPKLKFHCNTCNNADTTSGVYDINWINHGIMANQGQNPPYPSVNADKKPAGNEFMPETKKQIASYSFFGLPGSYVYYHHDTINNQFVKPEPLTANITAYQTWPQKNPNISCLPVNVIILPIIPTPFTPASFSKLDSLSAVEDSLWLIYDEIASNLDHGLTYELLDDIHRLSIGRLKNKLIENSPLSDTVLTTMISSNRLSPGNYKNVMERNLPVSKNVEPLFFAKLETLPNGIAKELRRLHGYNDTYFTLTQIEREINNAKIERQMLFNDILIALLDTGVYYRKEDAVLLLENENNIQSNKLLVANYIKEGDLQSAASKLSLIPLDNQENKDFVDYYTIMLNMQTTGRSIYELDSLEISEIREIAWHCPPSLAVANSRALLNVLYGEDIPECPYDILDKSLKITIKDKKQPGENDSDIILGDNYPDPFDNVCNIPYSLPCDVEGKIIIWDIYGRIIKEYKIEGENILGIDMSGLSPGNYYYGLIIDNELKETKKMILQTQKQ